MDLKDFKLIQLSHFDNAKSVDFLNDDADKLLYLDSSALRVFRDFKKHKALTVATDMPILDIKKKLFDNLEDIALVTNTSSKVVGTIALHYLEGSAIQKKALDEGLKLADMVANDAKIAMPNINMVSYSIIESTKIGHVLNTLINSNRHHIIVYDEDDSGNQYIRGYFSLAFIRRKLGIVIKHLKRKDGLTNLIEDL